MSALRRAAVNLSETDQPSLLFVNAGIDAARPLEAQKDSFWWPPGELCKLDGPYGEYARVIAGYDRHMHGITETPFTVTIDAGAGRGGALLAACVETSGALVETLEA